MNVGFDSWSRAQTLILSDEQSQRPSTARSDPDRLFVMTPLDMIAHLDFLPTPISTVVLAGRFGGNRELATFLLESYPTVRIVDVVSRNRL